MSNEIIIPDEIMEQYADVLPQEELGEATAAQDTAEDEVAEAETTEETVDTAAENEAAADTEADERMVPISALRQERAERRKLKEELVQARNITDRLLEATGATSLADLEAKMDETQKMRVMRERGLDEGSAQMFLDMQRENSRLRQSAAARGYDDEVAGLAKNPMYDDIMDVRDDVEEYARNKNVSIKEAYNALFGEQRAQRMQEAARKAALEEKETKAAKKIKGLSSAGSSPANEGALGLSADELTAALQAGMTPADYKKYKEYEME